MLLTVYFFRFFLLLALVSCSYIMCWSQVKTAFNIRNITAADGLPQSSVKDIDMDKYGYLWLMTEKGICRFDGSKLKEYKNTFLAEHIRPVHFRNWNDTLWIEYENGVCFILPTNKFNTRIEEVPAGFHYTNHGIPFQKSELKESLSLIQKKSGHHTSSLFPTGRNQVYAVSLDSIFYIEKNQPIKSIPLKLKEEWICLLDSFLISINSARNTVAIFHRGLKISSTKLSIKLKSNARLHPSNSLVYLTSNLSTYALSFQNGKLKLDRVLDSNYPGAETMSAYQSPYSNTLFIGTNTKGLFSLTPKLFTIFHTSNNRNDNYYSFAYTNQHIIANDHLFQKDGSWSPLSIHSDNRSLLYYKEMLYFISPNLYELWTYSIKTNRKKKIHSSIKSEEIQSIYLSPLDSHIYILSSHALRKLVADSLQLVHRFPTNNSLILMHHVAKDKFFFSTDIGLFEFTLSSKLSNSILSGKRVRTIFKDGKGLYWIGTYMGGYYIWNGKDLRKMPLDIDRRLLSLHAFYMDKLNRMWMSTNNGLIVLDYHTLLNSTSEILSKEILRVYNTEDGLKTNEFNGGCHPTILKHPDGYILLPSIDGLVKIYPDSIQIPRDNVHIQVDDVFIDGVTLSPTKKILIPSNAYDIRFEISVPNLNTHYSEGFEYRLRSQMKHWQISENNIQFNGLEPGEYTLDLRPIGVEHIIKSYMFCVEPKWYQTVFFKSFISIFFIILLYLLYRFRIRTIQKRNEELTTLVQQRTKDLNQTILDLENSESNLNQLVVQQNEILNIVLHDLRSPLIGIRMLTNQTYETLKTKNYSALAVNFLDLKNSVENVNHFVESFFQWIYHQRYGLKPVYTSFQLSEIYTELHSTFAFNTNLQFDEGSFSIYSDKNMLLTVMRNVVANSFKANPNGRVSISAFHSPKQVSISIADQGPGISPETISELLNPKSAKNRSGFGYKIIHQLLKMIHGTIQIESKKQGTTIIISVYI